MISNFKELLDSASAQNNPQRLLFLMAKTESRSKSKKQQTGTITPVMCVDKLPEDIQSFPSLVAEADQINTEWDFMLVAGLDGQDGKPPTTEDAEPYLNQMANNLMMGQDISRYVIFDRQENPIVIQC